MIDLEFTDLILQLEAKIMDHDNIKGTPPNYSIEEFRAITKIFMSAMMDKMYLADSNSGVSFETMKEKAHNCGTELRELIIKYTGMDTHDFYRN